MLVETLYAHDCELVIYNEDDMQQLMDAFTCAAWTALDLSLNPVVMYQPVPKNGYMLTEQ